MKRRKGFTLVELMVVVIIVGVLAAVAIPIYRANVRKAMASEGASLLGAVLTSEKVYYAEFFTFTTSAAALSVSGVGNKYFTNYTVSAADVNGFTVGTTGSGDASGITVSMVYSNSTPGGATISYAGL